MARITVEDCLEKVDNRFKLIHLAAKRVRQLRKGAEPLVESKNTDIVVSLREIAAGRVYETDYTGDSLYLPDSDEISEPKESLEEIGPDALVDENEAGSDKPDEA